MLDNVLYPCIYYRIFCIGPISYCKPRLAYIDLNKESLTGPEPLIVVTLIKTWLIIITVGPTQGSPMGGMG